MLISDLENKCQRLLVTILFGLLQIPSGTIQDYLFLKRTHINLAGTSQSSAETVFELHLTEA